MPKTKEGWIPKQFRPTLRCKACKQDKPPCDFVTHGVSKSGHVAYHSRCKECYYEYSAQLPWSKRSEQKRIQPKRKLIESAKLKCQSCGYDRCAQALDLHHLDPDTKEFSISQSIFDRAITVARVQSEIEKCVVLCCRCHRELHAGLDVNF